MVTLSAFALCVGNQYESIQHIATGKIEHTRLRKALCQHSLRYSLVQYTLNRIVSRFCNLNESCACNPVYLNVK